MSVIKVVVRCRPLNEKEIEAGHTSCVEIFSDRGLIEIRFFVIENLISIIFSYKIIKPFISLL